MRWKPTFLLSAGFVCTILVGIVPALTKLATEPEVKAIIGSRTGVCVTKEGNDLVVLRLPEMASYTLATEANGIYNLHVSPNGNHVVFETRGASGQPNRMIIRSLAQGSTERHDIGPGFYPHWWVNPSSLDTCMVWASQDQQESVTQYAGETYRQKLVNMQLSGAKEILLNQAFKAGLSSDGRWLGTAYQTPFLYDLKLGTGHKLTTFKPSTCWPRMNPTVDTSKTDQICYINNNHDTLITKNSKDQIVWQMPFPSEFGAWSSSNKWHSNGWSNHEKYMLTAVIVGGKYKRLLLDRSTKQYVKLFESTSAHQDMWISGGTTGVSHGAGDGFRPLPYRYSRDMAIVSVMGSKPSGDALRGFQRAVIYNARGAVLQEFDISRSDSVYSLDKMIQENRSSGPVFIRMYK